MGKLIDDKGYVSKVCSCTHLGTILLSGDTGCSPFLYGGRTPSQGEFIPCF